MQGVGFAADVFILDLKNYDMILGTKLKTIICNYKKIWMAFQEVCIKRDNPQYQ
jgi:hypothetical protein